MNIYYINFLLYFLLPCHTAYYNNLHRRLNMHLLADNSVICTLRDFRIYLHDTDQSQCIKQLQCIINQFIAQYHCILILKAVIY